eukprot:TRINITY_DN98222_c0_g1_i1.p1 TRINITY_DN98222_c0_g1~~TRINITY_DN98222_c0_g1_i1.p1  ORF type:complete len:371 (-),score=79.42 TRINITY_DN98222_c0_g1_i1:27-1115(-)
MSAAACGNSAQRLIVASSVAVTACLLLLRTRRRAKAPESEDSPGSPGCTRSCDSSASHWRTRSGGMKVSRIKQMVEDMTEACRSEADEVPPVQAQTHLTASVVTDFGVLDAMTWDEQVQTEKKIMDKAMALMQDVRQSAVHRKLPHFHIVDRQLQVITQQLGDLGDAVLGFWRYGRDLPMQELLQHPLLQLASRGDGALVPLSLGFVKQITEDGFELAAAEDDPGSDAALLGIALSADRDSIESAYRRRSRHFHRHGKCINMAGFHALSAARNRCLARLAGPALHAFGGGGDVLAHYLLMGTDPAENRYKETAVGILDAVHREQLLLLIQKIQWPCWNIPLTWGDEEDMIGFGGANHLGASG